ncbi:MAG TPA: STY0301 family protein [Candidatus Limnocylindrales bacterium]|nr:STY0301 family protein [Candidatus Limnocylindrales bacterium]
MRIRLFAAALIWCAAMNAADFTGCPAQVAVSPQRIARAVPGWTPLTAEDAIHRLASVTFYDGHPSEKASLAPDAENRRVQTWTFAAQSRAYWITCGYSSTTVVLARELGREVRKCVVRYDGAGAVSSVSCR